MGFFTSKANSPVILLGIGKLPSIDDGYSFILYQTMRVPVILRLQEYTTMSKFYIFAR